MVERQIYTGLDLQLKCFKISIVMMITGYVNDLIQRKTYQASGFYECLRFQAA